MVYIRKNGLNWNKKELNPHWKGGKLIKDGYTYIRSENHPLANKMGYVA
jgi:hypothetical protein